MSINSIGSRSALAVQALVGMRQQLDELQRQLGTGKKAEDYAGLGLERGLAVGLRTHLSAILGYGDAISNVGVRLDIAQTSLTRITAIGREAKTAALQSAFDVDSSGQTTLQRMAVSQLSEMLGLLNAQAGDRYLFSGRSADQPAVDTLEHILNGDGVRAGLMQVIDERRQADLGAAGLGRLTLTTPLMPTAVELAEEAAGLPFGFKINGVTSALAGATVAVIGPPNGRSIDLGAVNPNDGETIEIHLALPDGSTETLRLTATTSATPGPDQFAIGADTTETATNLKNALQAGLAKLARTSLQAASAVVAAENFFKFDAANPPQRVAGPPFDSAIALTDGTPADTVLWYTGDAGTDPARQTALARVDQSITVAYGLRANEEGLRWMVQNVATLAAVTFSPTDADASARYAALKNRLVDRLSVPPGVQKIEIIQAELAGSQATLQAAKDRHQQTKGTLQSMLQNIEGVANEEVAAQILALQTRLQASLQTTALLFETSLVKYL
jgi:flagellin-like hook-associated protein FlgL